MCLSSVLSSLDVASTGLNSLCLFSDHSWQRVVPLISTSNVIISCCFALSSTVHFGYSQGGLSLSSIVLHCIKLVLLSPSSSEYHMTKKILGAVNMQYIRRHVQSKNGLSLLNLQGFQTFLFYLCTGLKFFSGNSKALNMLSLMMSRPAL